MAAQDPERIRSRPTRGKAEVNQAAVAEVQRFMRSSGGKARW